MMYGTNDAKYKNWNETAYKQDYIEMARTMMKLPSKPYLYIMIPPPVYYPGFLKINETVTNKELPRVVKEIARELGLPSQRIID